MSDWIRVQRNDTLEQIAREHQISLQRLIELNKDKRFDMTKLDGNRASDGLKADMRDPDALIDGEKLRVGPAQPSPQLAPADTALPPTPPRLSDTELTDKLRTAFKDAERVATSDGSINDPLRLLAQEDPHAYAQQKVASEYATDGKAQKQLADCLQQLRIDDTSKRVKALMKPEGGAAAQPMEAAKVLDKALNSSSITSQEQRDALWKAAGAEHFDKAFFKEQLRNAAASPGLGTQTQDDRVSWWMRNFSENAPPEVARVLLDVFLEQDFKPARGKFDFLLDPPPVLPPGSNHTQLFQALSRLVQQSSELPGESRAGKVADWWLKNAPDLTSQKGQQPIAGSIAQGYGGRLTAELIDVTKGKPELADMRERLLGQFAKGGEGLRERAADARQAWQDSAPDSLRWGVGYFVNEGDPQNVADAVTKYRTVDPDGADGMDEAAMRSGRAAADAEAFVHDSLSLDLGNEPASDGERELGKVVQRIDDDQPLRQSLGTSMDVSRQLLQRTGYGEQPLAAVPVTADGLEVVGMGSFLVRNGKNILQVGVQSASALAINRLAGTSGGSEKALGYLRQVAPFFGILPDDAKKLTALTQDLLKKAGPAAGQTALSPQQMKDLKAYADKVDDITKAAGSSGKAFGNLLKGLNVATFASNIAGYADEWATTGQTQLAPSVMVTGNGLLLLRDTGSLLGRAANGLGMRALGAGGFAALSTAGAVYAVEDLKAGRKDLAMFDGLLSLGAFGASVGAAMGGSAPAWLNPVGIGVLALGVLGRVGINVRDHLNEVNANEPSKNHVLFDFVQELGFKEEVATHLLNQTKNGVSPMIAIDAWAKMRGISQSELFGYLNSLSGDQAKKLVTVAHKVIDENADRLVDDEVPPDERIPQKWLAYLEKSIEQQGLGKPPAGYKPVTTALDPFALPQPGADSKQRRHGPQALMSFEKIAGDYRYSLVQPDADVRYVGKDGILKIESAGELPEKEHKRLALDQLFKLNPRYDRKLLDGNLDTPRPDGVLDADAVPVGTTLRTS